MKYLPAWILLMLAAAACGDVLTLDDGTKFEGKAKKVGDQWIVTDAAGHETALDPGHVVSFELTGTAPGPAAAVDRLTALRTSADNLTDVRVIIDRYTQFIRQTAGTPLADAAQVDLAMWQRRQSEDYRKIGGRWLAPMERQVLAGDEAQGAANISAMIRRGQIDQAGDEIKRALTDDPDNPSALYLRGVLYYQKNQVAPARADFEHVLKTVGDHVPTLNNLAVTLWRQQNFGAAMAAFLKAMSNRALDQTILDNLAEAVHALPDGYQAGAPARDAAAMFAVQDKQLQKAQQINGLYRWGSQWVSAEKLSQLTAEKAEHESKLASLRQDEEQTLESLAANETQLQRTQAEYNLYNPPSPSGYGTGRAAVGMPDYYLINQDLANMTNIKEMETEKLAKIREQIAKVERSYSIVEYTGVMRLFGPEETPIRSEPAMTSTTQPGG